MKKYYIFSVIFFTLIIGCSYEEMQIEAVPNPDGGKSCNRSDQCIGKCIVPLQDRGNPHCEYYNFSRGCYSVIEDFYKNNSLFKCVD